MNIMIWVVHLNISMMFQPILNIILKHIKMVIKTMCSLTMLDIKLMIIIKIVQDILLMITVQIQDIKLMIKDMKLSDWKVAPGIRRIAGQHLIGLLLKVSHNIQIILR